MENEKDTCKCPVCLKREEDEKVQEELNFAILLALVPALAITLFSNMGLF
jgi:hypothetical protein